MKHYYLVDFENVADAGLDGFFQLSEDDTVYLFYSPKSNRINIDFVQKLLDGKAKAQLKLLYVSSGNQALDLQLASFLGSLVMQGSEDCVYTIVSRDKGFACLRSFWGNHAGKLNIDQASRIADARTPAPQPKSSPVPAPAPQAENAPEEPKPAVEQPVSEKKPEPVPEKQPEAAAEKLPEPLPVKKPEPAVEKKPEAESKPAQPKKPQPNGESRSDKHALNTAVQQALSKAKYEDKIISPVASLVSKAYGDKKIRQTVYRELIKLYGQKLGLEVYNQVKPLL